MTYHASLWRPNDDPRYQVPWSTASLSVPHDCAEIAECSLHFAPSSNHHEGDTTVVTLVEPRKLSVVGIGTKGFVIQKPDGGQVDLPFPRCRGSVTINGILPVLYVPWSLRSDGQATLLRQYAMWLDQEAGIVRRLQKQIEGLIAPPVPEQPPAWLALLGGKS